MASLYVGILLIVGALVGGLFVQSLAMRLVALASPPRPLPPPAPAPILHVIVASPAQVRALAGARVIDGQATRILEGR